MKRCPKCSLSYSDDTLEFCLEDGTRLLLLSSLETETQTVARTLNSNPTDPKTVSFPLQSTAGNPISPSAAELNTIPQSKIIKEKAIEQGNKILEIAPIVIALAHNWWQWIYLNNQSYSSFTAYFFSANFLIWLMLLIVGAAFGLVSLKRLQNNGFAISGLIILAVNLILFLVPKR